MIILLMSPEPYGYLCMQMSVEQLIQQLQKHSFSSEHDLYCFFITTILQELNLTVLLSAREETKKLIEDIHNTPAKQAGKDRKSIPSDRFYTLLSKQKQLLKTSDDTEFVILLASLKMLEELGEKINYKEVLKEILSNNLHKIRISQYSGDVSGREKEMAQIFRILDRSYKNNVLILGQSGVGKTSLAYAVLQKIRSDVVFQLFSGNKAFQDMIIGLLSATNGNRLLLFLDEVFSFSPEQIKQALENDHVTVFATASEQSYTKFVKNYPELTSTFEVITIEELPHAEIEGILSKKLLQLQQTHGVTWEEEFPEELYAVAKQYVPHPAFPAKGIVLLEELVSMAKSQGLSHLKKDIIKLLISQKTKIPLGDLTEFDKKDLTTLAEKLRNRVKGQDPAIDQVVRVIQRSRLGFGKKNRPIGSFLFVGPSGVGKTELAKAVAQAVFGNEENMVRLDMSEFSEAHTIQRLIGAPPGYVGFEEGGQLTNPVKAKPYNLVLLDEIEKAHARVFDIFLQVLDDGRLTDGQGKMVDFRHTVIIATSNAGLDDILDLISEGKNPQEIEKEMKEILQDYFRIEFINRFDGIIFFNALLPQALEQIARLQVERLKAELANREIDFSVTDNAITQLAHMSYDPRYGARELLRTIQDTIENKLAEMIITGQLQKNQKIVF